MLTPNSWYSDDAGGACVWAPSKQTVISNTAVSHSNGQWLQVAEENLTLVTDSLIMA